MDQLLSFSSASTSSLGDMASSLPAHALPHQDVAGQFRYHVVKRAMDVGLVVPLLPLTVPLLAALALIVWIDSPGAPLYCHRRIAFGGESFRMWKLRTMHVDPDRILAEHLELDPDAHAEWSATRKLRNDPRITRLGALLRRYSLDELPQLWNVLRGSMSLVGPRPIVTDETHRYGDCFSCYCKVKPGLTGLWQVSGRSNLTYRARVALDCSYVHHWSLSRDLLILCRTLRTVLSREGAI